MSPSTTWHGDSVVADYSDGSVSRPVDDQTIRLEVPARGAYLRYARLAAAALGDDLGYSLATIEALRTAVNEICAIAMAGAAPGATLSITLSTDARCIHIAGSCGPVRDPDEPDALAMRVLEALALNHTVWLDGEVRQYRMEFVG